MFRVRGRVISRSCAVMLASGAMVAGSFAVSGAAVADDGAGDAGATATLGSGLFGGAVMVDGERISGGLFTLKTDQGEKIQTYCIDFGHATKARAKYQETGWDSTSLATNDDAGKIKWILENAYPTKSVEAIAQAAGIQSSPRHRFTPRDAAAGTQAAIWHFSDGKDAQPVDKEANALTKYLVANAVSVQEPKPSLELAPAAVSGKSGDLLGPVNVTSNATAQLNLDDAAAKSGVKLVDKDGKDLSEASNGSAVYFSVPAGAAPGTATMTAEATTQVPIGRAFTSLGYTPEKHSQTMILAGSGTVKVSATAVADWAKKGAIPAAEVREDCENSKVVVTVANNGDDTFTGTVGDQSITVKPGEKQEVGVTVAEDAKYSIEVKGSNGFTKTFEGVLDCKTESTVGGTTTGGSTPSASPSTAPSTAPSVAPSSSQSTGATGTTGTTGTTGATTGDTGTAGTTAGTTGGNLAETGSSSATPMIAGAAAVLVGLGGGLVFLLRKRRSSSPSA